MPVFEPYLGTRVHIKTTCCSNLQLNLIVMVLLLLLLLLLLVLLFLLFFILHPSSGSVRDIW